MAGLSSCCRQLSCPSGSSQNTFASLSPGPARPAAAPLPLPRLQRLQHARCSSIPALKHWQQQHNTSQPCSTRQQLQAHAQQYAHLHPQQHILQRRQPCISHGLQPMPQRPGTCRAAASSQAFSDDSNSSSRQGVNSSSSSGSFLAAAATFTEGLADTAADLQDLVKRFLSLWRQFLPMLSLFFCLSFINTILDSLKDTLVITAVGGGAFVIPYLTVYAVLPLSMVFLVAFSAASVRMSRSALFNTIIGVFVAFFAGFALFLYPNAEVLHPHALADQLQQALPQGLAGAVGMFRNWTFTLFFCMSELWGDVCMGLLFWGLANEITNLSDAATLYPLFGLGANLAQALAGLVLKATTRGGATEFATALQASMAAVVCIACVAIGLQQHITNKAEAAAAELRHRHAHRHNSRHGSTMASGADLSRAASPAAATAALQLPPAQQEQQQKKQKPETSLRESFKVLAASVEIRCLAVMSLAQGLCNSLMEFAWKCHMRLLYPSPADFTAFLGDVATWSGVVTGGLMLLSPLLFERLGWRGVANATPKILLYGGSAFFAACIVYQHMFGHAVAAAGASAAGPAGVALLQGLVLFGALLYVFGKGAKFSLFKPAEEMVYITLDEDGRTRGKAAIDVVGAQTGKSGGSLLQQALLITSAGSIVGIMPVLFAVFFAMLRGWSSAVHTLSNVRHYSYDSPISSLDEDEEGSGPGQQQQHQQQGASLAAAAAGGSSSGGLQAAQQQELLDKLQGLADGGNVQQQQQQQQHGSKAFQAALARSGSGKNGSSSSSSSNGSAGGDQAPAVVSSSSSTHDSGHLGDAANSSSSSSSSKDALEVPEGSVHNLEFVKLSHDAAAAFRRSRRESHSNGSLSSSSSNSSNSNGVRGAQDEGGDSVSSSSSSRATQGVDGGSA